MDIAVYSYISCDIDQFISTCIMCSPRTRIIAPKEMYNMRQLITISISLASVTNNIKNLVNLKSFFNHFYIRANNYKLIDEDDNNSNYMEILNILSNLPNISRLLWGYFSEQIKTINIPNNMCVQHIPVHNIYYFILG